MEKQQGARSNTSSQAAKKLTKNEQLESAGLNKDETYRCEAIAELGESEVQELINDAKEQGPGNISRSTFIKAALKLQHDR